MTLLELAKQLRPIIEQAVSTALDDVTALRSIPLFPKWAPDISVKKNDRYQYNGVLYKVSQDHTTQDGWPPDKTPALWVAVSADPEQGTADNPITAVRGMEYTYGLYYKDGDKVYLCKRTGEAEGGTIVLQYLPHELVGQYFVEMQ